MFKKVLVANRGEIAVRVIRTCRRLGIRTVAVYSDQDQDALHVELADEAYHLGGSRVTESYLKLDAVTEAIRASGANAVHPGYGLLSEDAAFAEAVAALGVTFIGPNATSLRRFGDKILARRHARSVGIASPPGSDTAVSIDDAAALKSTARNLGYPLLVKAAAGGGGIGMAVVETETSLAAVAATCATRAQAAFGDARVYLERFLRRPRHIEVQLLGDRAGNISVLGERECSVQRRHQKIIEEAPSPASELIPLREELYAQARSLLSGQGYVGLATAEFLIDVSEAEPEPYFLEVNARLQVEHPVTELTTGLDLVELQLRAAAGEALGQLAPEVRGHAIEARLYAEDPARKFAPQPGQIRTLEWPRTAMVEGTEPGWNAGASPEAAALRVDSGYRQGDTVSMFYDPLIAKLIAVAAERSGAIAALLEALDNTQLELVGPKGPKATNLEFLGQMLRSSAFRGGDYDTNIVRQLSP